MSRVSKNSVFAGTSLPILSVSSTFYCTLFQIKFKKIFILPLLKSSMKFYLKAITPIFVFAFFYSFLSICLGARGFFARQQLKRQHEALVRHVQLLSDIGEDLNIRIANLSSDPQTIAVYAHELGYVQKNERLIKLMNFSGAAERTEDAGVVYLIEAPRYLPDTVCKTIAVSMSIIVIICEMIGSKKNAHSKKSS